MKEQEADALAMKVIARIVEAELDTMELLTLTMFADITGKPEEGLEDTKEYQAVLAAMYRVISRLHAGQIRL